MMKLSNISYFRLVGHFHEKFDLPRLSRHSTPDHLDQEDMAFRIKFLQEELDEIREADDNDEILGVADGLADLIYVALGTAQMMGIDMDRVFMAVHTANMRKERAISENDERSTRKHRYDVVKPKGWVGPDIQGALYGKTD